LNRGTSGRGSEFGPADPLSTRRAGPLTTWGIYEPDPLVPSIWEQTGEWGRKVGCTRNKRVTGRWISLGLGTEVQ
jgi:hypothetical protein